MNLCKRCRHLPADYCVLCVAIELERVNEAIDEFGRRHPELDREVDELHRLIAKKRREGRRQDAAAEDSPDDRESAE